MSRNFAAIGITFAAEDVARKGTTFNHKAQIPIVTDLDLFREHFGDAAIMSALDGSSIRVKCQEVNRRELAAGKFDPEHLMEACYLAIKGIRSRGASVRTVKVYVLAGGAEFRTDPELDEDANLVALQTAAMAAAVDAGIPADVARMLGESMTL